MILRCLQVFISKLRNEPMRCTSDVSDKVLSMTGYRRSAKSCKINHIVVAMLESNRSDKQRKPFLIMPSSTLIAVKFPSFPAINSTI